MIVKKFALVVLSIGLLATGFWYGNRNTVLREATGATFFQGRTIASWLGAVGVECGSVTDSTSPLAEGMVADHKAYDLIGKDGNTYLLILRREDNDFAAVLSGDGELLHGMIDNTVLPVYFQAAV